VLFAGGCHVDGFPVGADLSISAVALRSIDHPAATAPESLVYMNLRTGPKLAEACRERQTEILVLQLGHYETLPRFEKLLRIRRYRSDGFSMADPETYIPAPGRRYQPTLKARSIQARRLALAAAFRAVGLGNRVFDLAAMVAGLDSIFANLAPLGLRAILLLSPFPCPDPLSHSLRRRAAPVFAQAAQRHGCVYVDAFTMLEAFPAGPTFNANFADAEHLSRDGHQGVGVLIGQHLRRVIESGIGYQLKPPDGGGQAPSN